MGAFFRDHVQYRSGILLVQDKTNVFLASVVRVFPDLLRVADSALRAVERLEAQTQLLLVPSLLPVVPAGLEAEADLAAEGVGDGLAAREALEGLGHGDPGFGGGGGEPAPGREAQFLPCAAPPDGAEGGLRLGLGLGAGGLCGLCGAFLGGGCGLVEGVGLEGVAEGAGLADAPGEGLVGALGVFEGREVFEAMGAVGVEDAGLAGGAEGDGAELAELVFGGEVDEAAFPRGADAAIVGAAVVGDAGEGVAALEHGIAEGGGLDALGGGAREHLDVAGVLPAAAGAVDEAGALGVAGLQGPVLLEELHALAGGEAGDGGGVEGLDHGGAEGGLLAGGEVLGEDGGEAGGVGGGDAGEVVAEVFLGEARELLPGGLGLAPGLGVAALGGLGGERGEGGLHLGLEGLAEEEVDLRVGLGAAGLGEARGFGEGVGDGLVGVADGLADEAEEGVRGLGRGAPQVARGRALTLPPGHARAPSDDAAERGEVLGEARGEGLAHGLDRAPDVLVVGLRAFGDGARAAALPGLALLVVDTLGVLAGLGVGGDEDLGVLGEPAAGGAPLDGAFQPAGGVARVRVGLAAFLAGGLRLGEALGRAAVLGLPGGLALGARLRGGGGARGVADGVAVRLARGVLKGQAQGALDRLGAAREGGGEGAEVQLGHGSLLRVAEALPGVVDELEGGVDGARAELDAGLAEGDDEFVAGAHPGLLAGEALMRGGLDGLQREGGPRSVGSPPRGRGIEILGEWNAAEEGITPAWAGNSF